MPRAVGPIFVAAILLLIGGAVVAGLRVGGDEQTAQPETEAPGGVDVTDTASPFEDLSPEETPTPAESPSPTPTDDGLAADEPTTDDTPGGEESPTAAGEGGDEPGERPDDEDSAEEPRDEPETGDEDGDEPEPSETRSPSDDETVLAIDDMPDTGGGLAGAGLSLVVVGAAAAGAARRR